MFHYLVLCPKAWREMKEGHTTFTSVEREIQSSYSSSNFIYEECVGQIESILTSEDLEDFTPQSQEQRNEQKKKKTIVGKRRFMHHYIFYMARFLEHIWQGLGVGKDLTWKSVNSP